MCAARCKLLKYFLPVSAGMLEDIKCPKFGRQSSNLPLAVSRMSLAAAAAHIHPLLLPVQVADRDWRPHDHASPRGVPCQAWLCHAAILWCCALYGE